jgi:hypothetical protein
MTDMGYLDKYKVDVPEGTKGPWTVERFTVTEQDTLVFNMRATFKPGGRTIRPGTYTRLMRAGSWDNPIMSDTPAEIRDHLRFIGWARGDVLITGLGLGVVLQAVLNKPDVRRVTVIEIDQDVIDLVAPHYAARFPDRFEVIHGDALTLKIRPGRKWDCAWHDIWPSVCSDNLPTMKRLHRRFGRRVCDFQGSWCREMCEQQRRRDQRDERDYQQLRRILAR